MPALNTLILFLIGSLSRDYPANDCGVVECREEVVPNRLRVVEGDGKKGGSQAVVLKLSFPV